MDRPIPAFYCCYLLRSTVRHSNLYVGSTPNPARRLAQHNGLSKGGAIKTSRQTLRPWEMVCIVTGFPSNIAALQFEWAWQNPHLTRRIPSTQRLTPAETLRISPNSGRTRKRPPKPRVSLTDRLGNLHLLLRVKSFTRWPLEVRFFNEEVHRVWQRWTERENENLREGIKVLFDPKCQLPTPEGDPYLAPPNSQIPKLQSKSKKDAIGNGGVEGVDVGYESLKQHVEKSLGMLEDFEALQCSVCEGKIKLSGELVATCPTHDCRAASHLTCLSKHFLASENNDKQLLPTEGTCPECSGRLKWVDVVKELTLRTRGEKRLAKLLKKPRVPATKKTKKNKKTTVTMTNAPDGEYDDEPGYSAADDDSEDEEHGLRARYVADVPADYEDYFYRWDGDDDIMSVTSAGSETVEERSLAVTGTSRNQGERLEIVIEDSDFDADVLD